jgi:PAS domain S-box-containing protein
LKTLSLDDMPCGLLLTDIDCNILQYNRPLADLVGFGSSELVGLPFGDILAPASRIFIQTHILPTLLEKGSIDEIFFKLLKKDGEKHPVLLNAKVVKWENQRAFTWSIFGATNRSMLESELIRGREVAENNAEKIKLISDDLQRSNASLSAFTGIVTHDLKAPLRHISTVSSIIIEDNLVAINDKNKELFDLLISASKRMHQLVDDLHHYSKAGIRHREFKKINLDDFLSDIWNILAAPDAFTFSYLGDVKSLHTLHIPFALVIRNLVDNAIKHHDKDNGHITISCFEENESYRIEVSDDGPGIDAKYHKVIFDELRRLQSMDLNSGSGLGLSMVQNTLHSYGGNIQLQSSIGEGATFSVTWPNEALLSSTISS